MLDNEMGSEVVVCGPPGTEPVMRSPRPNSIMLCDGDLEFISKGRFDAMKSIVYSRVSSSACLSSGHTPSHTQVLSVPSKDIPRVRAEVYATLSDGKRSTR